MSARVCYLGLDVGTSSCKAILIGADGDVLASASAGYPLSIPRPNWAEQNPEDWVRGAREALTGAIAAAGRVKIQAIGLSGQMHGLVALDRDHTILRPAILWNDQRTERQCLEITEKAGGLERLLALTNNRMLPGYTGGKSCGCATRNRRCSKDWRSSSIPRITCVTD
jgi:xylulokinase